MFVKHIRGKTWQPPYDGEFLFECRSYQIQNMLGSDNILVSLDHDVAFEVSKNDDQLYIMNSNGKTIDSYDWRDNPAGNVVHQD